MTWKSLEVDDLVRLRELSNHVDFGEMEPRIVEANKFVPCFNHGDQFANFQKALPCYKGYV